VACLPLTEPSKAPDAAVTRTVHAEGGGIFCSFCKLRTCVTYQRVSGLATTHSTGRAEDPQDEQAETFRNRLYFSVSPYWYWTWGVLLLVPVWLPRYFATEDGLAHLYWVEVYRSLGNPSSPFHEFFNRNIVWQSPHHLVHFGLQYGLATILEPHLAQKVVVSLVILSWVAAIHFLGRAMCGKLTPGALAALLLVHSSWLYNGLFAFMGAVPLSLVGLGVLARLGGDSSQRAKRAYYYLMVGMLGIIAHYAHFFVGALFLLLVLVWLLFPWNRRQFSRLCLAAAMLPAAALAALYLTRGSLGTGGMTWESPVRVVARFVGLAFFRGLGSPTTSFWLALLTFGLLLAFLCYCALRTETFHHAPETHRFVIVLVGLLLIIYFVSPVGLGEAYPLSGRFQFTALAFLLPSLPCRVGRRRFQILIGGVSLLLGWQVITFSGRELRFSRDYAAVLHESEVIPHDSVIATALLYGNARYEGSFVRILASIPEDLAFRRHAILINSYFPRYPYYWVRPRTDRIPPAQFRIDLERRKRGLSLLVERTDQGPLP
jgi:hypothetical protein